MVPISVDGTPLLGLIMADGHLLLNLNIFDEFNAPVIHIKNNPSIINRTMGYSIIGTKLTVRESHRMILIEIDFQPPNKVVINRGCFLRNGVEILVRPTNILVTNTQGVIVGNHAHNCFGGLIIGHHANKIGGLVVLGGIPRYLGDRTEALKFERETMAEINVIKIRPTSTRRLIYNVRHSRNIPKFRIYKNLHAVSASINEEATILTLMSIWALSSPLSVDVNLKRVSLFFGFFNTMVNQFFDAIEIAG